MTISWQLTHFWSLHSRFEHCVLAMYVHLKQRQQSQRWLPVRPVT